VAKGEVELGLFNISEVLPVKGVTLVGPLPAELQSYIVFTAAIHAGSAAPAPAAVFIKLLSAPAAREHWKSRRAGIIARRKLRPCPHGDAWFVAQRRPVADCRERFPMQTLGLGFTWEQLSPVQRFRTLNRTLTETDLVMFTGVTGMLETIFIDRHLRAERAR